MNRRRDKILISLSIIVSIAIHVVAIASINKIEMKSFSTAKGIAFDSHAKEKRQELSPKKEFISLVLKQNSLNKLIAKNHGPSQHGEKLPIKNKITCKNIDNTNNEIDLTNINEKESVNLITQKTTLPMFEIKYEKYTHFIDDLKKSVLKEKKIEPSEARASYHPEREKEKKLLFSKNHSHNVSILEKNEFFQDLLKDEKFLIKNIKKSKLDNFNNLFMQFPPLLDLPSLDELTTLSYKDFFNIDVAFAPDEESNGFIFAITLHPKSNLKLDKLKQNVFFLIDRSNSIQRDRLTATRHAITSSLNLLDKEDKFNILAFDTKLDVLSQRNLFPNSKSISNAKNFLLRQNIGSFFSSSNFSIPLFKILNRNVKDDEINIAILLSNGDGLNKIKNYRIFNEWTKLNGGNLSLYTLSLNNDKNQALLELFSTLNRGKMLSSSTNRGLKRKLQKLIKSINAPIAKDISSQAICLDKSVNIKLFPTSDKSPNLYLDQPYIIIGTTDKLEDFTLFIQGKCRNKYFNLKKHISFDSAKQAGKTLQKELALKKANLCYEKYLADNNPYHLEEAKNHLEPFEVEPTFR